MNDSWIDNDNDASTEVCYRTYEAGLLETFCIKSNYMFNTRAGSIKWTLEDNKIYYHIWNSAAGSSIKSLFWP